MVTLIKPSTFLRDTCYLLFLMVFLFAHFHLESITDINVSLPKHAIITQTIIHDLI